MVRTAQPAKWHLQIPGSEGRSFEVQAAPLVSGDSSGAVAILHDISELERLENVRRDFVANVSHEFRTPLAAITGYADTLLDGALEDPANNRRFLEIIRSNAIRLNNIAADLLTISELQRGSPPLTTELIPIGDAIESALSTMASEASLRGVTLAKRADPESGRSGLPLSIGTGAGQPAGQCGQIQPARGTCVHRDKAGQTAKSAF